MLNEPGLIEQLDFQIFKNEYKDETKIVSNIMSENDNYLQEIKKRNIGIKLR